MWLQRARHPQREGGERAQGVPEGDRRGAGVVRARARRARRRVALRGLAQARADAAGDALQVGTHRTIPLYNDLHPLRNVPSGSLLLIHLTDKYLGTSFIVSIKKISNYDF